MSTETLEIIKTTLNVITEHKDTIDMLFDNTRSLLTAIFPLAFLYLMSKQ